jgi:hypothetical protein
MIFNKIGLASGIRREYKEYQAVALEDLTRKVEPMTVRSSDSSERREWYGQAKGAHYWPLLRPSSLFALDDITEP